MSFATFVQAEQKVNAGWCEITVPDSVKLGSAMTVQIKLGAIADGMKVRVDLHGKAASGAYSGFNESGTVKTAKAGETVTFTIAPVAKAGADKIIAIAYLSPTGEYEDRVEEATSAQVPLVKE